MIKEAQIDFIDIDLIEEERIVGRSYKTLGNFKTSEIKDIILVDPNTFDRGKTVEIAAEVGKFNEVLHNQEVPYLLIGPGRWGTTERWLGVPVAWNQINGAKVILEAAYGTFAPTHLSGPIFSRTLLHFKPDILP